MINFHERVAEQLSASVIQDLETLQQYHLVPTENTLEHVMCTALRCERVGLGFAAGYRSALQALLPELAIDRWAAMCVTETEGNHPRNIHCSVDEAGVLNGEKSFVTLAELAPQLLVVAKAGDDGSKPILKAALVDSRDQGITTTMMPALPMIPEVGHGKIQFESVKAKLLSGDGYADYSKRFRTIEDSHVLMAFISVLVSIAYRYHAEPKLIEKGCMLLASLLHTQPALKSEHHLYHLQLAALFDEFRALCVEFDQALDQLPESVASAWIRDKKLFGIAGKAREARREKARQALFTS